jgi:hypothetical protein
MPVIYGDRSVSWQWGVLIAKLSKYLDQSAPRDICDRKPPSKILEPHTDWFFDLPEKPEQLGLI